MIEEVSANNRSRIISYGVFAFTLTIVILNLVPIVFPASIVRLTSSFEDNTINPFEPGALAIPLFIVSFILIGMMILGHKGKLPKQIIRLSNFIQGYDISWKIALVIILILFSGYFMFTWSQLFIEETYADYVDSKKAAENWSPNGINAFVGDFKYFILHYSIVIFKNIRMIPLMTSISLLILVYLTTLELTQKRISAIIAVIIVLQSNNFLTFDRTSTYANFWILFYLLSLYLVLKKWYFSHISYILSIFSKALTAIYIPMTLFFIMDSKIEKRKKIFTTVPYVIMGIIFFIATQLFGGRGIITSVTSFNYQRFWNDFGTLSFQLRRDELVVLCLLPLIIALYIQARKNISYVNSIIFFLGWILLTGPLLAGFTTYSLQPYRQIPLIIFFAIGVGFLFSNKLLNRSYDVPS